MTYLPMYPSNSSDDQLMRVAKQWPDDGADGETVHALTREVIRLRAVIAAQSPPPTPLTPPVVDHRRNCQQCIGYLHPRRECSSCAGTGIATDEVQQRVAEAVDKAHKSHVEYCQRIGEPPLAREAFELLTDPIGWVDHFTRPKWWDTLAIEQQAALTGQAVALAVCASGEQHPRIRRIEVDRRGITLVVHGNTSAKCLNELQAAVDALSTDDRSSVSPNDPLQLAIQLADACPFNDGERATLANMVERATNPHQHSKPPIHPKSRHVIDASPRPTPDERQPTDLGPDFGPDIGDHPR